jgi:hypothetical protein
VIIRGATLVRGHRPHAQRNANTLPATDVCPHVVLYSASQPFLTPSAAHLTTRVSCPALSPPVLSVWRVTAFTPASTVSSVFNCQPLYTPAPTLSTPFLVLPWQSHKNLGRAPWPQRACCRRQGAREADKPLRGGDPRTPYKRKESIVAPSDPRRFGIRHFN